MKKIFLVAMAILSSASLSAMEPSEAKPQRKLFSTLAQTASYAISPKAIVWYDQALAGKKITDDDREEAYEALMKHLEALPQETQAMVLSGIIDLNRADIVAYHLMRLFEEDQKKKELQKEFRLASHDYFKRFNVEDQKTIFLWLVEYERSRQRGELEVPDLLMSLIETLNFYQLGRIATELSNIDVLLETPNPFRQLVRTYVEASLITNINREKQAAAEFDKMVTAMVNDLMAQKAILSEDDFLLRLQQAYTGLSDEQKKAFVRYLVLDYGCTTIDKAKNAVYVFTWIYNFSRMNNWAPLPEFLIELYRAFEKMHPETIKLFDLLANYALEDLDAKVHMMTSLIDIIESFESRRLLKLIKESKMALAKTIVDGLPQRIRQTILIRFFNTVYFQKAAFKALAEAQKKNFLNSVIALFLPHFLDKEDDFLTFGANMFYAHEDFKIKENYFDMIKKHMSYLLDPVKTAEYMNALRMAVQPAP